MCEPTSPNSTHHSSSSQTHHPDTTLTSTAVRTCLSHRTSTPTSRTFIPTHPRTYTFSVSIIRIALNSFRTQPKFVSHIINTPPLQRVPALCEPASIADAPTIANLPSAPTPLMRTEQNFIRIHHLNVAPPPSPSTSLLLCLNLTKATLCFPFFVPSQPTLLLRSPNYHNTSPTKPHKPNTP